MVRSKRFQVWEGLEITHVILLEKNNIITTLQPRDESNKQSRKEETIEIKLVEIIEPIQVLITKTKKYGNCSH